MQAYFQKVSEKICVVSVADLFDIYYLIWSRGVVTKRTTNNEANLRIPTLTNGEGITQFYFFPGE